MVLAARLDPELQADSGAYVRHQPEKTLLYQTVQNHKAAFFAQCEASERSVPSFIKEELEALVPPPRKHMIRSDKNQQKIQTPPVLDRIQMRKPAPKKARFG